MAGSKQAATSQARLERMEVMRFGFKNLARFLFVV
jgi:hypothetical protein